ncbi:MAG: MBL fold metallo-hydrolase [Akkermansiaceae bacterium]|nr:MBL fold metallo-hydrolase [Akkermansiaceae bacterium]NNM29199.1 MBL fold metallo-hydrolase [Akkermansiaceae bacterium]
MRLAVLGSGSAGNAAVLEIQGTRLLFDAGLSARQLCQRLEAVGISPDSLDAILLSHEHSDHTRGLRVFLRNRRVPVFTTAQTRECLRDGAGDGIEWRIFQRGQPFDVKDITVEAFAVPHDAVDPVGFVMDGGGWKLGLLTDIGHVTTLVREQLKGVRSLFVESNYDQQLLEADTKRPWSIKQRIASRHGHLSNAQTAELVSDLACHGLKTVVLGHLSQDCNCPEVAGAVMREAAGGKISVHVAGQRTPTPWVKCAPAIPQPSGGVEPGLLL